MTSRPIAKETYADWWIRTTLFPFIGIKKTFYLINFCDLRHTSIILLTYSVSVDNKAEPQVANLDFLLPRLAPNEHGGLLTPNFHATHSANY